MWPYISQQGEETLLHYLWPSWIPALSKTDTQLNLEQFSCSIPPFSLGNRNHTQAGIAKKEAVYSCNQ